MKRKLFLIAIALSSVSVSRNSLAYDLVSLWESRSIGSTDTFYTTYFNDFKLAIDVDAHAIHGVAAYIPCASDALAGPWGEQPYMPQYPNSYSDNPLGGANTHGYPDAYMYFACAQPSGTLPLYRLYKGSPQLDHIYTTSASEVSALEAQGYSFDRVEGYLFSSQIANSVPLYRLSLGANIPNHDVEHRYTVSATAKQGLLNAGWTYEGITGYVFSSYVNSTVNATGFIGTFNGQKLAATNSVVSVPITNVTPSTQQFTIGGLQSDQSGSTDYMYGAFGSNTTVRPAGSVRQLISFNFYTGDLFGNSPGSSPLNHIPIYLHYSDAATSNLLSALPGYDGIALVIANGSANSCGAPTTGGQLYIELGSARAPYGASTNLICDSNLLLPMQNNTWYQISYSLSDSATVSIGVSVDGLSVPFLSGAYTFTKSYSSSAYYSCPLSGALSADQSYCANPFSWDGFPVAKTGYMILPYFSGPPYYNDTTAQISNLHVGWLNY